ncbi:pentatricopeptide repeat-containing protein [Quercus suber]|uniref:Pentatricopeptide repeat-containing protein n=1 Tax=Quercus suber TaxID=58331 RepID=A0AAW0M4V7_QUESU
MNVTAYTNTATPTQLSSPPKTPKPPLPTQPSSLPNHRHRVSLPQTNRPTIDPVVSWTSSIARHCRNAQLPEAAAEFQRMRLAGVEPNHVTFITLLSACADFPLESVAFGSSIHAYVRKVEPDYVTIIAVLSACANLGTLGLGLWMNRFVMKQDFKDNIRISNSLIDMYSRCGCIEFAHQIFEKMTKRTLVSWNSIIVGFAVNGHVEEALEFFGLMQKEGFKPDGISFTGALTACSHAGLVDEGLKFFDEMKRVHRITPRIEHYGCIVDLYSRAGRLEDALNVIENMPMKPNEVVLGSLLAACRTHGNVSLAERLMNYLSELDPSGDSNYVLLANMYAAIGRWDGASKIRRTMKARGIQKKPGSSSIEIDCSIHEFVAGDNCHAETDRIHAMLELLSLELKLCGYVPQTFENESYEDD